MFGKTSNHDAFGDGDSKENTGEEANGGDGNGGDGGGGSGGGGGGGNGGGNRRPRDPDFDGPWSHRVAFAPKPGGGTFAFRPRQVLTDRGAEAVDVLNKKGAPRARLDREVRGVSRLVDVDDPIRAVGELRMEGFLSQLNVVFFAHSGCGCGGYGACPPHPSGGWGSGGYAQSVHPTPYGIHSVHPTPYGIQSVHPTPYGIHSVHPTPYGAQSVHPTPFGFTSVHPTPYGTQSVHPTPFGTQSVHPTPVGLAAPRKSSARPTPPDNALKDTLTAIIGTAGLAGGPHVIVLDTGLATGHECPKAVKAAPIAAADPELDNFDFADVTAPADDLLDEVAGHGTFIAGLIDQVAPGCHVTVHRVLASVGDTDEHRVVDRLEALHQTFDDPEHTILSLSFGGYVPEFPLMIAGAIADIQAEGVVVVASAGNDGTCEPMYPAALPGVVSVGAIGPDGPAHFTNYGPWVRACAPGVDLMSTFFQFSGATPAEAGQQDPDNFNGWALWSGTSFSGPVVAGVLARTMIVEKCTATEAVKRVVDNPSLLRIPGLGTVVNAL